MSDYTDSKSIPGEKQRLDIRQLKNREANPFYPYFSRSPDATRWRTSPDFIGFSLKLFKPGTLHHGHDRLHQTNSAPAENYFGRISDYIMGSNSARTVIIFPGLVDKMVAGAGEEKLLEALGRNKEGKTVPHRITMASCMDKSLSLPVLFCPTAAARGC
ncbi:MAG: hypothetical protein MZU79_01705 [Anaerotruncus sp.]|nr:hypothetical protein [Anaerotruncus sp.]